MFTGGLGWLRAGMTRVDVEELLGAPQRVEQASGTLIYAEEKRNETGRGWRRTFRLPFRDGKLLRLGRGWTDSEKLEAAHGSRAWIEDTLRKWGDAADDLEEGKFPELPQDEVDLIREQFHSRATEANGREWDFWCRIIADLKSFGIDDNKALDLVVKRFPEQDLYQFQARWVLENYEFPERKKLIRGRLSSLLANSEMAGEYGGELNNLYASLIAGEKATTDLIRIGTQHELTNVCEAATKFLSKMPREEAREILREKISDSDDMVRFYALLNIGELCTAADLNWLRAVAKSETNDRNLRVLEKRIADFE